MISKLETGCDLAHILRVTSAQPMCAVGMSQRNIYHLLPAGRRRLADTLDRLDSQTSSIVCAIPDLLRFAKILEHRSLCDLAHIRRLMNLPALFVCPQPLQASTRWLSTR
jgi:hypothetical protein